MKQRLLAAVVLLLGGFAVCRGEETGYRVKVVAVDAAKRALEAKFVVMPEDMRLICSGDPKGVFVGDYVTIEIHDKALWVGKLACNQVAWLK